MCGAAGATASSVRGGAAEATVATVAVPGRVWESRRRGGRGLPRPTPPRPPGPATAGSDLEAAALAEDGGRGIFLAGQSHSQRVLIVTAVGLPPAPHRPNPAPLPRSPPRRGPWGARAWEEGQPNGSRLPQTPGVPSGQPPWCPLPKKPRCPRASPPALLQLCQGVPASREVPESRGIPRSSGNPQESGEFPAPAGPQEPWGSPGGGFPSPQPPQRTHLQAAPGLCSPRALVTMAWRQHVR